ncbi:FAD-binding oxidoreductase [Aeromicrobium sp. CTD01-1L150]|uniref:FAD-binding oxidoreductase n=1 Tax=Aeromicrobium sp. CTD01-1L150 TaxID=3341830 RepID=UPI0035C1AE93
MDALAELIRSLPDGAVVVDPDVIEAYRYDWSREPGAGTPVAVVRPGDAAQVQATVQWAAEHRVPVVPRGAGSGLSGGSSAVDGGIVLSLERMRAVEIDPDCQTATVEPGALNAEVKLAAGEHDLWYPPDPSSYEICSIGGNVATNAGGLCCVKYGVTTDYVLGLDVVLADGTLVTLGGQRIKDVAGLSLLKLFVGSEGTLGIVTRAILRLVPAQAVASTVVATFAEVDAAARAVVSMRRGLRPSMLELMDRTSINAVEDYRSMGLDRSAGAMLVVQSDAPGAARAEEVATVEAACADAGATAVFLTDDPDEGELFVEARRAAFPAIGARGAVMLEDVGAAVPLLPELLASIASIAQEHDVEIPVVAHAGDGNTHPIIVYDETDPDATKRAGAAFDAVMAAAIELGGTITGEHGVGRTKRSALPAQLGEDVMALSRRVKSALDPDGILNPGAVL